MKKILFVDDEPNILQGLKRMLRDQREHWDMTFVGNADEALNRARKVDFDAIVTDVKMPGRDGFDLLEQLREIDCGRDVPVVMITGANESDLKRRALEHGATDLLNKPIVAEDLIVRLRSVLRLKSYQDELKRQNEVLDEKILERTAELVASRLDIVWRLGKAAEYRDEETGNHVVRVGCYSRVLSEAMGLDFEFTETMFLASPLHDIGKIGIPDGILLKPGALTDEERSTMRRHCVIGAEILRADPASKRAFLAWRPGRSNLLDQPLDDALLTTASTIALGHHERWDGTGYPNGLAEERIPLEARIVAIADVYDALRSERPYKPAYSEPETVDRMKDEVGRHFDPDIYAAFERSVEAFSSIRSELADQPSAPVHQECTA